MSVDVTRYVTAWAAARDRNQANADLLANAAGMIVAGHAEHGLMLIGLVTADLESRAKPRRWWHRLVGIRRETESVGPG